MDKGCLILLCLACMLASACQNSKLQYPTTNTPTTAQSASPQPSYKPRSQPTEAELREVIRRNYEDAVTIDNSQSVPFLTGDFNGDGSEDIAIVVKPAKGKVSELNSEYVNWILEDPRQVNAPGQKRQPVKVSSDDSLLAVIHGYERQGWRSNLARQTYLLKNAILANLSDGVIRWTGAKYLSHPAK